MSIKNDKNYKITFQLTVTTEDYWYVRARTPKEARSIASEQIVCSFNTKFFILLSTEEYNGLVKWI